MVSNKIENSLKQKIIEIFAQNRRQKQEFQYTVPSLDSYPYQWLWDSCFHAIILSYFDIKSAKKELLSLVSKQFENGLIPHIIYWGEEQAVIYKGEKVRIDWGKGETSSITQPPLLAYAAWQIFQKEGEVSFLEELYPSLFHYYKYLLNERDPHERHLVGIINPDESGEDNSPRFDAVLDLPPIHEAEENFKRRLRLFEANKKCRFDAPFCMKNFFWVKDVPFNTIVAENLSSLAQIAQRLERSYDAQYFGEKRDEIIQAMRELMFEDGIFWPTYGEDYRKIKVKTWAIFAPLFAKIYSREEAEYLVNRHLLNKKEFWPVFLAPTVAMDETAFDPVGFWRGPVWTAVNWFIFKGLLNYGFNDIAGKIKESSLELLRRSGFREYFNPLTGEGLGASDFTWGGLVLDM